MLRRPAAFAAGALCRDVRIRAAGARAASSAGLPTPLAGIRVLELAGLAPAPFAGQILADFGADVLRVDKPSADFPDPLARGKRSIIVDTSTAEGRAVLRSLVNEAKPDVVLDPYRPGVLERMLAADARGASPTAGQSAALADLVPGRTIVARISGYGHAPGSQYGPAAGHDINYLAMSGLLSMLRAPASGSERRGIGRGDDADDGSGADEALVRTRPLPPSNFLADFAGGSLLAVQGVLLALLQRGVSGHGQVVDASMTAGAAYLGSLHFALLGMAAGSSGGSSGKGGVTGADAPGSVRTAAAPGPSPLAGTLAPFLAPGEAPYYDCYACGLGAHDDDAGDAGYVAVGAIEPPFFAQLMACLHVHSGRGWPQELGLGAALAAAADATRQEQRAALAAAMPALVALQQDRARWPALRRYLSECFRLWPREHWERHFAPGGSFGDACVTPVLSHSEALTYLRRGTLAHDAPAGAVARAPLPAPVLSHSPDRFRALSASASAVDGSAAACGGGGGGSARAAPPLDVAAGEAMDREPPVLRPGAHSAAALRDWLRLREDEVARLLACGAVLERQRAPGSKPSKGSGSA